MHTYEVRAAALKAAVRLYADRDGATSDQVLRTAKRFEQYIWNGDAQ